MSIVVEEVGINEAGELFPLLLLAEASRSALHWSLSNLSDTIYRVEDAGQLVGAITMRWNGEPCEIVELAVAEHRQGQGLGKQIVRNLLSEARHRGKQRMIVGTGNSSIDNIIFYQKCGFRMDHVRRDYFWYHRTPDFENGIRVRDMIVFSYDIVEDANNPPSACQTSLAPSYRWPGRESVVSVSCLLLSGIREIKRGGSTRKSSRLAPNS